MKDNGLPFVMRIPKHYLITDNNGQVRAVTDFIFENDKPILLSDCQVDGVWVNVWFKPLSDGDYLFIVGTVSSPLMGQLYRKRWTIESGFQNLKSRGFTLCTTHIKCCNKLKKLIALVSLSYSFCLSLGVYLYKKVQPIKIKKHDYKASSFSRFGLNQIRQMCRDGTEVSPGLILKVQSLFRWLNRQLVHYQALKIVG